MKEFQQAIDRWLSVVADDVQFLSPGPGEATAAVIAVIYQLQTEFQPQSLNSEGSVTWSPTLLKSLVYLI